MATRPRYASISSNVTRIYHPCLSNSLEKSCQKEGDVQSAQLAVLDNKKSSFVFKTKVTLALGMKKSVFIVLTVLLVSMLGSCNSDEAQNAAGDATNDSVLVEPGTVFLDLATVLEGITADENWIIQNSDTFGVYLYSESDLTVDITDNINQIFQFSLKPGNYTLALLIGDSVDKDETLLLAAGYKQNLQILSGIQTAVTLDIASTSFELDLEKSSLDDIPTNGTMELHITGNLPFTELYPVNAPTVQIGNANPVAINMDFEGNAWTAIVRIPAPSTETDSQLTFNPGSLMLEDSKNSSLKLDQNSVNWKMFLGNVAPYSNEFQVNVSIKNPNQKTVCATGCDYGSITNAINALPIGGVLKLSAGNYSEDISISKRISIIGAGSGENGTVIKGDSINGLEPDESNVKNGVIQLSASGVSANDPILIKDLRIEVDKMAGISVGLHNDDAAVSVSNIRLENVKVIGKNADPSSERERGLYVSPSSSLQNLFVQDSSFDNMTYGWYLHKKHDTSVAMDTSNVKNVTVLNTSFNHNFVKGIYAEKLSDALFSNCVVSDNGFSIETEAGSVPSSRIKWMTGVDINLKAGDYENIHFFNCTVNNNGHGYKEGVGMASEGAGYAIKARDDAPDYNTYPATLTNVSIVDGIISKNERGIRLGEAGKTNAGPAQMSIKYVRFESNEKAYLGSDGSAYGNIINLTDETTDIQYNYWGDTVGNMEIHGITDVQNSFETAAELESTERYVTNITSNGKYFRIQNAIDAASIGDLIEVAPGKYDERLVIDKSLTLRGATYLSNKKGYTIPANYQWDSSKESIINNPKPESVANLVDIKDTSKVVFEGFIVQSLNALKKSRNDHLLRLGADSATLDNIIVRNNVIGPNTNIDSQDGTHGRMGLYLALPNTFGNFDILNSVISGNKIIDAKGNGNNVFIWGGAEKYSSERGNLKGTLIQDNEISGSHRTGIEIAGSADNLVIKNNLIHKNSGTESDDASALKYGNGIVVIRMGSDKTSSTAEGSKNVVIEGNEIYNNEKNGIYMGPINQGHLIQNNKIYGNGWDAVRIDLTELYHGGFTPIYDQTSEISLIGNSLLATGSNYGANVIGNATNGFVLEASGNYWGHKNGPCSTDDIVSECGSLVSDGVGYESWLVESPEN